MFRIYLGLFLSTLLIPSASNALEVTANVTRVGSSWEPDFACAYLSSGDVIRMDLSTEKGKAELSISLLAIAANKELYVYFNDTAELVGGCNTGTTVRTHGIITLR